MQAVGGSKGIKVKNYFRNLSKIEFVLTQACTGRCKHCSEGDHSANGDRIDPAIAANAVRSLASKYGIKTVMVFGGEPLLHIEAVERVMKVALELGIPHRQIITNGFFTKSERRIAEVVRSLAECGVNDLLLSADAFHQQTIPLDTVKAFAREAVKNNIPIRLQPAWLVSREDTNEYNEQTRKVLASFSEMNIPISLGNVIFPEGNALKYLGDYFKEGAPKNPYEEDPFDVHCISVSPNGDVLSGNVYKNDILDIMENYQP